MEWTYVWSGSCPCSHAPAVFGVACVRCDSPAGQLARGRDGHPQPRPRSSGALSASCDRSSRSCAARSIWSAIRYSRGFPMNTAPPTNPARNAIVQTHGESLPNDRSATTPAANAQPSARIPTVTRIARAARRSQRHLRGTAVGIWRRERQSLSSSSRRTRARSRLTGSCMLFLSVTT